MTKTQIKQMEKTPFPISFSCVDMFAVCKGDLLMITKSKDKFLRLPGGFVDPTDVQVIDAAMRELNEETGVEKDTIEYYEALNNFLTEDKGRYSPRSSKHRLRTSLFFIGLKHTKDIKPGDDAQSCCMVPLKNFYDINWVIENVLPAHIPLIYYALKCEI